jgi:TP901 family phage tail tape measure protein
MDKNMNVTVALTGVDKLSPKLREAIGRVNEITTRAKLATDKLKAIAITQNQIRSIDQARDKMRGLSNQIKVAEQNARAVADRMKIGSATQGDLDKATAAVKRLQTEYDRLGRTAMDTRSKLNAKGLTGPIDAQRARLQSEQAGAMAALKRQERMQAAQSRADAMRSRAGTLATVGVGMMAPGYAITRGLGGSVSDSAALNAELRQISVTGDMTDERMDALRRTIIRTSAATGQSTAALVGSTGFMVAAGSAIDVAERSQMAIGKTASAYKADMLDLAQTSFVLTDALGILPDRLQGSLGIMAKAGKEGNVELRDMAKVIPSLSAGMVALKVSGNEAVATIAAGLQIARKGSASSDEAANNMKNFLTKVLSPETLKKATEKFDLDLYGVITRAQSAGQNPVEAALDAISKVTKGGDQKLLGDLFQDMQVQSFLRPMLQNMDEYRRIKAEALGAASGSMIDEDFARIARDMDVSTSRLGNAWENLRLMVGNALAPALQPIIAMLGRATVAVVAFADRHPKLTQFIAILAGVLGVLLLVGGSIALMIAAVLVPMAALTLMAGVLGVALLPIILIIVGIGVAIAAVVGAFVWFREELAIAWEVFSSTWMAIGTWWQQFSFADLGRQIATGLVNGLKAGLLWVWDAATGLANKAVGAIKSALGIHSPSRVFADLGGHTSAGLALGITRGAPAAVESVRRMAAGITVAGAATLSAGMAVAGPGAGSAPGAGAGASGGFSIGQVTFVIHDADDPQAVARAVEAQLRKMATQARTDAQSRFFDDQ